MSLSGKVAFITGSAKNLGAQIARELAPLGANLALHYNSESTKPYTEALVKELTTSFPNIAVKTYAGDMTTETAVNSIFSQVKQDFKQIDIVVNTIGIVLKKPLIEVSKAEYDHIFAINSKAAFFILQASAKNVVDSGKLITIVTSLLAAYTGFYTSYAGSKAPVEHFTRGLSKELMPRGISVNAIAPRPMDTPFFYPQEGPEAVEFHKSSALGGHLTKIEDIAPIVKFLVIEG